MLSISMQTANVYGIYGHLGGGKTLTAVDIAVNNFLKCGHSVVSNIRLSSLGKLSRAYHYVEDVSVLDWWSLPCGAPRGSSDPARVAVIIDECAEFFDQYSGNRADVQNALSWLRHSSKRGQFVFLIVQKPEFVNKSLRLLINFWICCDDMAQYKIPLFHVPLPFTRGLVNRHVFDRWGNLVSPWLCTAEKAVIGRYYDTAQCLAVGGRANNRVAFAAPADASLPAFPLVLLVLVLLLSLFGCALPPDVDSGRARSARPGFTTAAHYLVCNCSYWDR